MNGFILAQHSKCTWSGDRRHEGKALLSSRELYRTWGTWAPPPRGWLPSCPASRAVATTQLGLALARKKWLARDLPKASKEVGNSIFLLNFKFLATDSDFKNN